MANNSTDQPTHNTANIIDSDTSRKNNVLKGNDGKGSMTISEYLAQKGIKGGVSLDPGMKVTASALLSTNSSQTYKIGSEIAKGGMGTVLHAKELNCRRDVAMKVLSEEHRYSNEQILRFIVEAQICAQLEHPAIVPVYELNIDPKDRVFYTMKYVRGVTLVDVLIEIKQENQEYIRQFPLIRLLNIFLRVCDAVAFAHSKNVVHRDLKPENIMIGEYGEVLVMDWGLAKILNVTEPTKISSFNGENSKQEIAEDFDETIDSILSDCTVPDSMKKTMYGQVMGTPGFMPPEQALGKVEDIDNRSDVYALGGILYNILTLQPPIIGMNIKQLIRQIIRGEIQAPSLFNQEHEFFHCPGRKIPDPLSAIAMKGLSSHPGDRYQNIKELQHDVEKYLGGFATSVEDAGFFKLLVLLIKRNKTKVVSSIAVLLVLVALVTAFLVKIVEAKEVAEENLHKFIYEHSARKEISRKLLMTAIVGIKEDNPEQEALYYRYSLLDDDFALNMPGNAQLSNINSLEELPLTRLDLSRTRVRELDALKGMPIKWLNVSHTDVKDLKSVKGLPLDYVNISNTPVESLAPLAGIELKTLNVVGTNITDLNNLINLPLTDFTIDADQLRSAEILINLNLEHLGLFGCTTETLKLIQRMGIASLEIHGPDLKSLHPIRKMNLSKLSLVETNVRNIDDLNGLLLTSLRISGGRLTDLSSVSDLPLRELRLERCYHLQDLSPITDCRTLEKLLIPSHIEDIEFVKKLKYLKVLATTVDDFENGQSVDEFWEIHHNTTAKIE